jgi:hypothetical protein
MSPPNNLADCQRELEYTKQQLAIQTNLNETLRRTIWDLNRSVKEKHGQLQHDARMLSQELEDAHSQEQLSLQHELAQLRFHFYNSGERESLVREIEDLRFELAAELYESQKWKDEAHGKGTKAISRCWQASVDEAVRKERESDSWLVRNLFDEIDMLKAEKAAAASSRGIDGEVAEMRDSLLVKSLRAEIAILRAGYMSPDDMRVRRPW